jgi:hypothetical protein
MTPLDRAKKHTARLQIMLRDAEERQAVLTPGPLHIVNSVYDSGKRLVNLEARIDKLNKEQLQDEIEAHKTNPLSLVRFIRDLEMLQKINLINL